MLPGNLLERIKLAIKNSGDDTPVQNLSHVGGGCINNANCITCQKKKYFLKWNASPLPGMFEAEALGLKLMRDTGMVRVPQVITFEPRINSLPAFILMEWLEPVLPVGLERQLILGRQLALMHLYTPTGGINGYGLESPNYIGSNPQKNELNLNWISFFRENRLRFQVRLAEKKGLMPVNRRKKLDQLMDHLDDYLGGKFQPKPALLHGDLWGGNVIPAGDGLALIDPAVYYGDHEAELAFTELFGGFSPLFYKGYSEVIQIDPGYKTRKDIYNLYHLLNHLNLFGEGYGSQVDEILRYYLG